MPGSYSASDSNLSAKSAYVAFNLEPALNVKLPVIVPEVVFDPVVNVVAVIVVANTSPLYTVRYDATLVLLYVPVKDIGSPLAYIYLSVLIPYKFPPALLI